MQENLKPDVEEQYTSATHTSNLRVEMDADRRSNADILMAAAWSPSRIGAQLMRLHSEWEAAEHPRQLDASAIARLAESLDHARHELMDRPCDPNTKKLRELTDAEKRQLALHEKADTDRRLMQARAQANQWHRHEVALLLGKLKSLPEVRHQLAKHAEASGIPDGKTLAAEVIQWWLDRTCKPCGGTKLEVISGTGGRQSGRLCKACKGRGESFVPQFEAGRWLATYMDDCVNLARIQIKGRLRNLQNGTTGA